jgi:hypothetical protein
MKNSPPELENEKQHSNIESKCMRLNDSQEKVSCKTEFETQRNHIQRLIENMPAAVAGSASERIASIAALLQEPPNRSCSSPVREVCDNPRLRDGTATPENLQRQQDCRANE